MNAWQKKIAPKVDRAVENDEPYFEVLVDDRRYVSLMTIDITGDNTLVYLTRREAEKLAGRITRAAARIPTWTKAKKPRKARP